MHWLIKVCFNTCIAHGLVRCSEAYDASYTIVSRIFTYLTAKAAFASGVPLGHGMMMLSAEDGHKHMHPNAHNDLYSLQTHLLAHTHKPI
jgi:hypothetical protein